MWVSSRQPAARSFRDMSVISGHESKLSRCSLEQWLLRAAQVASEILLHWLRLSSSILGHDWAKVRIELLPMLWHPFSESCLRNPPQRLEIFSITGPCAHKVPPDILALIAAQKCKTGIANPFLYLPPHLVESRRDRSSANWTHRALTRSRPCLLGHNGIAIRHRGTKKFCRDNRNSLECPCCTSSDYLTFWECGFKFFAWLTCCILSA